jgi:hypothetical protein
MIQKTSGLPTADFYQFGYVTRDYERALELFAARFGVPSFDRLNLAEYAPPGMKLPRMIVGLAYRGTAMIEIIQPDPEEPGIYGEALPNGAGVALHHLGYLVKDPEEWRTLPATLKQEGYEIAMQSAPDSPMGFAYIDARPELGHYLEFCQPSETRRKMWSALPSF